MKQKLKCLIWGNGGYYQHRKKWIPSEFDVLAFIHGNPEFHNTFFEGKRIISPDYIKNYDYDIVLIAVKDDDKIAKQLMEYNVPGKKIKRLEFSKEMIYLGEESLKPECTQIGVYYFDFPNVGDMLNMFMLDKLFNVKVFRADFMEADMVAVGSMLDAAVSMEENVDFNETLSVSSRIHIWGTGFIRDYYGEIRLLRELEVHALRGNLTRNKLSEILHEKVECVLADPGLLASVICDSCEKKYEVGIVPHYIEREEDIFYDMQKVYPNAVVIDVTAHPMEVLRQISRCKCILSTSLHGLIIADSYNIPNQWCVYTDRIIGDGFKYRDYYSAFNLDIKPFYLKWGIYPNAEDVICNYSISPECVKQKQKDLIECFPKLNNEMS